MAQKGPGFIRKGAPAAKKSDLTLLVLPTTARTRAKAHSSPIYILSPPVFLDLMLERRHCQRLAHLHILPVATARLIPKVDRDLMVSLIK